MKKLIKIRRNKAESIASSVFFSGIIYYILEFLRNIFYSEIIYNIFLICITIIKLFLLKLAGEVVYILIKACNVVTNEKR